MRYQFRVRAYEKGRIRTDDRHLLVVHEAVARSRQHDHTQCSDRIADLETDHTRPAHKPDPEEARTGQPDDYPRSRSSAGTPVVAEEAVRIAVAGEAAGIDLEEEELVAGNPLDETGRRAWRDCRRRACR